jgi:hypothetical protein
MFSEYCDKTFTVIGQWSDKLGINSSTWKLTISIGANKGRNKT